jgi:hypothetical protein
MSPDFHRLLNVAEAAERLNVSASYLNKLRSVGGGPPFVKIGARVAYDPADLAVWLEAQKRTSTADLGSAA